MKRPLAYAGFLYLSVQLLAAFVPPSAYLPLTAVFVLAILPAWRRGGKYRPHAVLSCAVPAAALALRMAFSVWTVAPVQARAGTQAEIQAAAVETAPGFWEDAVRATVLIDTVDGASVRPFRAYIPALPELRPGERFTARVEFADLEENAYRDSHYADKVFIAGNYVDGFALCGEDASLWARAARLRLSLGASLRGMLPQPYAGMAAAMTVGDRSLLENGVMDTLRRAGLAHVIVISGLHLSALSGTVYVLLYGIGGYRVAPVGAIAAVLGFLFLTGSTPSVVRAGTAMLLLYIGALWGGRSDGLTSLGAAALLLCLQNPYAALDTGLLLSFSATLGVLWVSAARSRWLAEHEPARSRPVRALRTLFWTAAVPLATTLTTLPVLIAIGTGISLLSVVSNLLVVPILFVDVGSGFVLLCAGIPGLGFLEKPAALACSLAQRWILLVAEWAASVPYAFVHVSGAFALCVAVLVCFLAWAAWRLRVPVRTAVSGCLLFTVLCGAAYAASDAGVVRIELAGSGANPPLVVLEGLETAVIYRGPAANVEAVRAVLEQYNRTHVDFLMDLRADGDTAALADALMARETVSVSEDLVSHGVYAPFHDVLVYARRQAEGNFACVEVRGYRVGVSSGSVDFSPYPAMDIFVAGTGRPTGLSCTHLIVPRPGSCRWLEEAPDARLYGRSKILLRAGASAAIREVTHDFE